MRLGIYGGSFDPVHYGHLLLAECCREQCALDQVWFVPAYRSPHKRGGAQVEPRHRAAMLRLAVAGHPAFQVSTCELEREEVSYTVETLSAIRAARPDDQLFFLLGGDALSDFPQWREPRRIAALATLVAVHRSGSPPPDFRRLAEALGEDLSRELAGHEVEMPGVDFSSRDLRLRVAAGQSIRFRTPRAVEEYISQHGLYRNSTNPPAPT
ncbi:MAG: nicotinate-nucleotide adenylyltransferase [Pirellulales bacterium]